MTPYEYGQSAAFAAAGLEKTGGVFTDIGEMAARGAKSLGRSVQSLAGMPKAVGQFSESRSMARGLEQQARQAQRVATSPVFTPQRQLQARTQSTGVPVIQGAKVEGGQLQIGPEPKIQTAPTPESLQGRADIGRRMAGAELRHQAGQAAPAAGVLAAGAMGTGYAMSPADTWENRVRRSSDRMLGTNFGQQSRIGAFFG